MISKLKDNEANSTKQQMRTKWKEQKWKKKIRCLAVKLCIIGKLKIVCQKLLQKWFTD